MLWITAAQQPMTAWHQQCSKSGQQNRTKHANVAQAAKRAASHICSAALLLRAATLAAPRDRQPGNLHGRSPRLGPRTAALTGFSSPHTRRNIRPVLVPRDVAPRHTGDGLAYRVLVEPVALGVARLPCPTHMAGGIPRSNSDGSRSQPAGVLFGLGIQVCVKCSRISRSRRSRGIKLGGDAMFDLATTLRHPGSLMMPV